MTNETLIRVVIADDHDVVRQGLQVFLRAFADLEFVGEARNGQEAVELCESLHPHVVLMDVTMPMMDGIEATRRIVQKYPSIKVLGLTSSSDGSTVQSMMAAGATGYILKNAGARELADAIRSVFAGRYTLAPEAAQAFLHTSPAEPVDEYQLSPRELEVLALMIKGLNNIDIADKLFVSRSTIKFHVSSILSKLNVSSRTQAVALALEKKLIG